VRTVFGELYQKEKPGLMLGMATIAAVLVIALVVAITGPVNALLGESAWAAVSAIHGMTSLLFVIAATMALYLAWRLHWGKLKAFQDLKILTTIAAVLAAATITFGNWIYIAYRAPTGPRTYFLENSPDIHAVFFEFKEFAALFTLPLFVVAAWALWNYGPKILENKEQRAAVSVMIALGWMFLMIVFMLGAAITKLRGV